MSTRRDSSNSTGKVHILRGVTIITMDQNRRIFATGALVIEDDRILWVGDEDEIPSYLQDVQAEYLPGRVVLPGFVNLHTHAALTVLRGVGDDIGIAPAYSPKVPQGIYLTPEDVFCFSLLGGLEAVQFGTTCIVDNYIYEEQAVKAFDELGLRAVVSERLHDADLFLLPQGRYEFDLSRGMELLEQNIRLFETWNGKRNGRIWVRFGPHAPDTCSPGYLKQILAASEEKRAGLVIHLAQSRREVQQISERGEKTPVKYLNKFGFLGDFLIAAHCIYLTEDDKKLLSESGTNIVHLSTSNAKSGMLAPIIDLKNLGANIGIATDNMTGDMIEAMRFAVCLARIRAEDPQVLRCIDVLEMATVRGAQALGLENEIGSIEVGKKADIVIIDFRKVHLNPIVDPIANLIYNGLASDIERVYVDGRLVVENGYSTQVDCDEIIREAQERARILWEKVK
ncbi:MAG: amidohydrolase [Candidatus Methanomethylicaceae archaeon]